MLPILRFLSVMAMLGIALVGAARAEERSADVAIAGVNLGFAGKYRVGLWTIAHVKLKADGPARGRLAVVCPDGDGIAARYRSIDDGPISLTANEEAVIAVPIRPGRTNSWLRVEWEGDDGHQAERIFAEGELPEAALASQRLVVTLGNEVGVEAMAGANSRSENSNLAMIAARLEHPRDLPEVWYGYEGVSVVVVATQPSATGSDFLEEMTPKQISALDRWLRMGGRIVVSVGKRGDKLLRAPIADEPTTAAQWLSSLSPGRFEGVVRQRTAVGLESFAGASALETDESHAPRDPLDNEVRPRGDGAPLEIALLRDVAGQIIVEERSAAEVRPLVIRKAHGLGLVVFFAADLDRPPFSIWADRPRLMGRLLDQLLAEHQSEAEDRRTSQLSNVGYTDIAGQLRATLDEFPSLTTVGFLIVAIAITAYLAVIGPIDYFLLRRYLPEQMEGTWVSYPLAIALFCGGAWLATSWLKGDRERINQFEVIDVDVATQPGRALMTGQIWTHIYRPTSHVYNLQIEPLALPPEGSHRGGFLSFQGLPGNGFDGMHASAASPTWPGTYDVVSRAGQMQGLPLESASTKSLYGRWWWEGKFDAASDLRESSSKQPLDDFANPLNVELHDCHLLYNRWITRNLGTLSPGQKVRIEGHPLPDGLEDKLTRSQHGMDAKASKPAWDPSSRDMERLAEMFLFHEAAGGQAHTKLTHRYQPSVDLTGLLGSGRAVLIGRVPNRASRLMDGERIVGADADRHWTWYRIVFPVKPSDWKPRNQL